MQLALEMLNVLPRHKKVEVVDDVSHGWHEDAGQVGSAIEWCRTDEYGSARIDRLHCRDKLFVEGTHSLGRHQVRLHTWLGEDFVCAILVQRGKH